MRKNIKAALLAALSITVAAAFAGCSVQKNEAGSNSTVTVKTAAADKHRINTTLDVAGLLVPDKTASVSSKITGQVVTLKGDVGSHVSSGSTIIQLETASVNAQLQQAQASLQASQAALASVQNQADLQKINLDTAQRNYNQTKALYDSNAVAKSQLDDDSSKLDTAKKQYQSAAGPALSQAKAAVSTSVANINSIKVQLQNTIIKSPITGIIMNRNINQGEVASPGVSLMTIADTSVLRMKGTVSQEYLPLLREGENINVSVDIYPDKVFKGSIKNLGPMAVSTGEIFPIDISIPNSGSLKPGLSAHATLDISEEKGVIVPITAVMQKDGQSYIFVVKNNMVEKRTVTTGLSNNKEIEILKGLAKGEKVAVSNVNNLVNNMVVNAVQQ